MSLLKRVGFYLVGVSLGLIFLAYFFREKRAEFCYLPNCRTLKSIRTQEKIEFSPSVQQLLDNNTISEEQLDSLLTFGEVNFSKSDVDRTQSLSEEKCSTYYIDGQINNKPTELVVKNCRFKAEILDIDIK
ncbi:DUF4258 domain-containing protein [Galbibacter mesophilus]|uniref:DUF4258 domain-containing protein n=1 Tax=Galbibacter mesophilus TaxID=379069 RepID=UPI00191DC98B|nr:DUF4258 domain-containing protein [Galbibacter mesophilus]MCM5663189.1 DUF4258 domain-containing protein [Galbibacter mesophilus]